MYINTNKAFTLVELMVAISIFTIVVAIGVGGFVHTLHTQREIAALVATQSNTSVALEEMTREIRTGFLFCTYGNTSPNTPATPQNGPCSAAYQAPEVNNAWTYNGFLDFMNANGDEVQYKLINGSLERSQDGGATWTSITASNVYVSRLTFIIFGNTEGDNWPPRITISLSVAPSSTDPALASDILNLQTTVSAREIDCTTPTTGAPEC
jgi:prepilin-type N-terminal cleavage/methylation domain-containing protein